MGVSLGEISAILPRQAGATEGAQAMHQGLAGMRAGFRDKESKRRALDSEAMAVRRQDEIERAAKNRERQEAYARSVKDFDDVLALTKIGATDAAVARGELAGIDVATISPDEFKKRHEEARVRAAEAAPEKAPPTKSEAPSKEAAPPVSGKDAVPGMIPTEVANSMVEQVQKVAQAALAEQQAKHQAVGPGMQAAMGAPPQAAVAQPQQPQAQPAPRPAAMQAAMGAPPQPQQRPAPQQQAPQQMRAPQSLAATDAAMGAPNTGIMMGGRRIDPIARQREIMQYQAAQQRQLARQVRQEKIARAVPAMQKMVLGMASALPPEEAALYVANANKVIPAALEATGGDHMEAWKLIAGPTEPGQLPLKRQHEMAKIEAKKKRRGGGGPRGIGGSPKVRRLALAEYKTGEGMIKDQLKAYKLTAKIGALEDLEKARGALSSGSASDHMEAVYAIAQSREPGGRLATADVENVPGNRGILQRMDNMIRKALGDPGSLDAEALLKSVNNSIARLEANMQMAHRTAERARDKARERGGHIEDGGNDYFDTTFSDPRLSFLVKTEDEEGDASEVSIEELLDLEGLE